MWTSPLHEARANTGPSMEDVYLLMTALIAFPWLHGSLPHTLSWVARNCFHRSWTKTAQSHSWISLNLDEKVKARVKLDHRGTK